MILRQVDKRNTGSIGEFRLVLNIHNLPFGADGMAIHDDCEVVRLPHEEHVARLDLHAAKTDVRGFSDPQIVKDDKGYRTFSSKTWMFAFFLPSLIHLPLPAEGYHVREK